MPTACCCGVSLSWTWNTLCWSGCWFPASPARMIPSSPRGVQALGGSREGPEDPQLLFSLWHLALTGRTRSEASLLEVSTKVSPEGKSASCHLSSLERLSNEIALPSAFLFLMTDGDFLSRNQQSCASLQFCHILAHDHSPLSLDNHQHSPGLYCRF